ncbi:MAG TPA: type 1 glutamine amidotransferase domain-containing protein [Chthonomonadaceae bacterium]|nr:type 1 glutamine amidotransferase domain-containing protein [Chthonomonadaceae bacterium]
MNSGTSGGQRLAGKRIAILATDGFEQAELMEPRKALDEAGAQTQVVSQNAGQIKGWAEKNWGKPVDVDLTLDRADPNQFDGLLLPGGVMNPDKLRMDPKAVQFVKAFVDAAKPIAAICHGPWTLIEAGGIRGRTITSWPSLQTDIRNAGGTWVDREVQVDNGIVTSRKPDDIPAFNRKMIEEFAEGIHNRSQSPGKAEHQGRSGAAIQGQTAGSATTAQGVKR